MFNVCSIVPNARQRFGYEAWRFSESVCVHQDTTPNEEPERGNHSSCHAFIACVERNLKVAKVLRLQYL